jgi:hypothetical protein
LSKRRTRNIYRFNKKKKKQGSFNREKKKRTGRGIEMCG